MAQHIPVLLQETLDLLVPAFGQLDGGRPDGLFVDCTLGLGGHTRALLEACPQARCLGIDRDPEALAHCERELADLGDRLRLVEGNFHQLESILKKTMSSERPRAVLADLGVSSLQLDTARRGFSFRFDGPLDMRMGTSDEQTAADIVNHYPEADLERIFRDYGEERQARRIAGALVALREEAPLTTTEQLREAVISAKGRRPAWKRERIDPATQVFQALRIEVNQELVGLEQYLEDTLRLLEPDGRLVMISYHSLEDRIVKRSLRGLALGEVDMVTGRARAETQLIEALTRKPIRPSEEEVERNPRCRSARLRAARRRDVTVVEGKHSQGSKHAREGKHARGGKRVS